MDKLPRELSLVGKVAIVTGSSRSIGAHFAKVLSERGAKIAICYTSDSSTEQAQAFADQINRERPGHACIVKADLADPECGKAIVQGCLRGLNTDTIDILVNNAAIAPGPRPATDVNSQELTDTFNVNVRAPMLIVQELLPYLAKKDGRIINISSVTTRFAGGRRTVYGLSKAALDQLTLEWAAELPHEYHCTVNGVRVGPTVTAASEAVRGIDEARDKARAKLLESTTAAPRLGEVDDHAQVVAWLASEGSRWINGQIINSSGGVVFH